MFNKIIIIICSIILIIYTYYIYNYYKSYINSIVVKSNVDFNFYRVIDSPKKQESADLLGRINLLIQKLINHLSSLKDDTEFTYNIFLLKNRYTSESILENIFLDDTTSYTINKGENLVFCIKSRDTNEKFYDINLLMYVVIHELAHVGTNSIGHNTDFINFFLFLLKESEKIGIYKQKDYEKNPEEYCGMIIK